MSLSTAFKRHALLATAVCGAGLAVASVATWATGSPVRVFPSQFELSVGNSLEGPAVAIAGDSLQIRHAIGKRFDVRLAGITAPRLEDKCHIKGQTKALSSGALSRDFAANATKNTDVLCTTTAKDNRNNLYARCRMNGQDMAAYMVAQGYARPSSDEKNLATALRAARTNKKGLWGLCRKPFT